MQDYHQVLDDPQVLANQYLIEQEIPTYGKRRLVANPVRLNGAPGPTRSPPPALGAHNEEILSSLGYDAGSITEITQTAGAALRQRLGT